MNVFLDQAWINIAVIGSNFLNLCLTFVTGFVGRSIAIYRIRVFVALAALVIVVLQYLDSLPLWGVINILVYAFNVGFYLVLLCGLLNWSQRKTVLFAFGVTALTIASFLLFGPYKFHVGLG